MMIGQTVRQARERLKWSQAKLAREAGTSQQNIARIENDDIENSRFLPAVMAALKLEPDNSANLEQSNDQGEGVNHLERNIRAHNFSYFMELSEELKKKVLSNFLVVRDPTRKDWSSEEFKTAFENITKNKDLQRQFVRYFRSAGLDDARRRAISRRFIINTDLKKLMTEPAPDAPIADRVRWARLKLGISQKRLAENIGANQVDIYRIESGEVQYSRYLQAVMRELGLGNAPEQTVSVVGHVDTGAEIHLINNDEAEARHDVIAAPPGIVSGMALLVRGPSLYPVYNDGDLLIFDRKRADSTIGALVGRTCYVKLADGRELLKVIQKGSTQDVWNLVSHNAPPIEDVVVLSAFPIAWVKPKS